MVNIGRELDWMRDAKQKRLFRAIGSLLLDQIGSDRSEVSRRSRAWQAAS